MPKEPFVPYEAYVQLCIGDKLDPVSAMPVRSIVVMKSVPAWKPTVVVRDIELGPFFDYEGCIREVAFALKTLDRYWAGRADEPAP